jgi:anti-sigma B factor antagonist
MDRPIYGYPEWSMDLPIETSHAAGTARVHAGGEVDLSTVDQLRAAVLGAAEDSERLVLDLSRVGFIDTTGLATLIELRSTLQSRGVLFEIEAADGPVRQAVDVTGLHHLLAG